MSRPLVYLAIPYSHDDVAVQDERFELANRAAAALMAKGHIVYSPISHCHPIAKAGKLPVEWEYWKGMAQSYLSCCRIMFVLCIDGWRESIGVQGEIDIAQSMDIPVVLITMDKLNSLDII